MSDQPNPDGTPANTGVDEAREMPPGTRVGPAEPGERDEAAVEEAAEQLEQPGGGH